MEFTPFNFEEADEVREDFEDLIDTEFSLGTSIVYIVQNVIICPFHEKDQQQFMEQYQQQTGVKEAISLYTGDECDVALVIYDADDESNYSLLPIRKFAAEKGIQYNFPDGS